MVFTYWAATPLITDVIVKATRCTNTTKFKLIVDEGVAHYFKIILAHHCDWVSILSYKSFILHLSLNHEVQIFLGLSTLESNHTKSWEYLLF